jgi:microsomal epoxide hydrolase
MPIPFTLHVPDADIADLRERLKRTRFPDAAPGEPWAYGASVDYMRDLVAYWRNGFDWRAQEARLNAFPQFKQSRDDIDLHVLHVPGKGPKPIPLLLLHGWPGSVFEFLDFIPRLTDPAAFGGDPADSFTVVAPSLPGYGLSFRPGQTRYGVEEIAACMVELMASLGYQRFGVQGGDWGGITAGVMAARHADRLIGAHVNFLAAPRDPNAVTKPDAEQKAYIDNLKHWLDEETGYQVIQGTKPQTLSFALTDSPAGLAAWIVEKFRAWTDCGGDVETALTRDQMLADISFYWFTGAIGSSFFPYYYRRRRKWPVTAETPATAPVGYAEFPKEILRPPRSIAEKVYTDIRRWTVFPRGGHFAAMEQPEALAGDVAAFFRELR